MLGEEDVNLELISLHFQLSIGIYNTESTEMGLAINTEQCSKIEVGVCVRARMQAGACICVRVCACLHACTHIIFMEIF